MRTDRSCTPSRLGLGILVVALWVGGCKSGSSGTAASDPMEAVRNPQLSEGQRMRAVDAAWERVEAGEADRRTTREDLKTLAWSPKWPEALRVHTFEVLLADESPAGLADSRRLVTLRLPREESLAVIDVLSEAAARRGWTDAIPALVRSLSRFDPATPDADRPEYRAIQRLQPDRPVRTVVLELFVKPPPEEKGYGGNPVERIRADAWDVLSRLDPTGEHRASLIVGADPAAVPAIGALRAALDDLHTLPKAGEELTWLWSLHDPADARNRAWWAEAAAVIRPLYEDRARVLELRHAEPIRWAARTRSQWLHASRAELLQVLEERLRKRSVHRRTEREANEPVQRQSLPEQSSSLEWGDLITILTIDDALREDGVIAALFAQADMDRADRSAEYGGLLEAWREGAGEDPDGAAAFRVVLYPPRPGQRRGDREFVASSDMIEQGDRSLAHYHFHAQEPRNSSYAGPSPADLAYAARLGRTCLVFTSVGSDTLNADLYQPDGVVLDLGELRRP